MTFSQTSHCFFQAQHFLHLTANAMPVSPFGRRHHIQLPRTLQYIVLPEPKLKVINGVEMLEALSLWENVKQRVPVQKHWSR